MLDNITDKIIIIVILLTSVPLHEFAHCWTDDRLGDPTPRSLGRVTLNPLAHLDLVGTIMMIVSTMSGFGFGWGKPSPFNPVNFRNPAFGRMIGAFAGPLCNILQMFAWIGIYQIFNSSFIPETIYRDFILNFSYWGIQINAVLAIFNLLPIYPLDGHHILSYLLPYNLRPIIDNPAWMLVLLILIFSGGLYIILHPVINVAMNLAAYLIGIQM